MIHRPQPPAPHRGGTPDDGSAAVQQDLTLATRSRSYVPAGLRALNLTRSTDRLPPLGELTMSRRLPVAGDHGTHHYATIRRPQGSAVTDSDERSGGDNADLRAKDRVE
jgi:hypothetical protein